MRCTIFLILFALAPTAQAADAAPAWPVTVSGYGLTVAGAKQHGLREAARLVRVYVQNLNPPLLDWEVTEEFVEKNLLDGPGTQGKEVPISRDESGPSWIYRLKSPDLALFSNLNRQAISTRLWSARQKVASERSILTGWITGGVLALLLASVAYGRLADRRR